jgi:tRNA(Ile2)-agmatinylcytidine synthase
LIVHIGFDDTDSPEGGCTTYLAAILAEKLVYLGANFTDYPNLIRLNPNTPWKTRGNAAVCLRFEIDDKLIPPVKDIVLNLIDSHGEFWCGNTNPGVVFNTGKVHENIKKFSDKAVKQIVKLEEAEKLINLHGLHAIGWKNRRGIIGGLSSIGSTLDGDHTYELITYRIPENRGTTRKLDPGSIRQMDKNLYESTFNNLTEDGSPIIAPHGPDPVLYGVRGESAAAVHQAYCMIKELEPVERWLIYRSNQGTDAHFMNPIFINQLKPHNPAIIKGIVYDAPKTIRGGHVIFKVRDSTGIIECAAYEPTGDLRHIVWKFIPGDQVTVYGGVRPIENRLTLNVEKIDVTSLTDKVEYVNPTCPECGGSTESMGREQGYRCKKCGYRDNNLTKVTVIKRREIEEGTYLPDRDAQRHLTKPLKRYGKENHGAPQMLFEPWIGTSREH